MGLEKQDCSACFEKFTGLVHDKDPLLCGKCSAGDFCCAMKVPPFDRQIKMWYTFQRIILNENVR